MKSVLQTERVCFICGTTRNLHEHHVLYGTANRKISERYGLKVYLCMEHHTGTSGVHRVRSADVKLKQIAQKYYESNYGDREDFIKDFGRSYL